MFQHNFMKWRLHEIAFCHVNQTDKSNIVWVSFFQPHKTMMQHWERKKRRPCLMDAWRASGFLFSFEIALVHTTRFSLSHIAWNCPRSTREGKKSVAPSRISLVFADILSSGGNEKKVLFYLSARDIRGLFSFPIFSGILSGTEERKKHQGLVSGPNVLFYFGPFSLSSLRP